MGNEERTTKLWRTTFGNKAKVLNYDVFSIKDVVDGKTLAQWMTGYDQVHDFGAEHELSVLARTKLRELLVRMIKSGAGFVGDMNPSNLIFSEVLREWVVIDGNKSVACYSRADHEWIWLEYCQASMAVTNETILDAFRNYSIGPNPTGNVDDDEAFGVWLKSGDRDGKLEGPSAAAKAKMIALVGSIKPENVR
jgi:hypothetical protein